MTKPTQLGITVEDIRRLARDYDLLWAPKYVGEPQPANEILQWILTPNTSSPEALTLRISEMQREVDYANDQLAEAKEEIEDLKDELKDYVLSWNRIARIVREH